MSWISQKICNRVHRLYRARQWPDLRVFLKQFPRTIRQDPPFISHQKKIEGLDRNPEGGAEQLVITQPADGGANLPFVDALAALEELLELIPHAGWGVALPKEAPVESLL